MENEGIRKLRETLDGWPADKKGGQKINTALTKIVAEIYNGLGGSIQAKLVETRRKYQLVVKYNDKKAFVVKVFYTNPKGEIDENRLPPVIEQAKAANADGVVMVSSKAPKPKCQAKIQELTQDGFPFQVVTFDDLLAAKDTAALRSLLLIKKPYQPMPVESVKAAQGKGWPKITKKRLLKIGGFVAGAIGVISGLLGIYQFYMDTRPPAPEETTSLAVSSGAQESGGEEYSVSLAVSDTVSNNYEPTKKIVATASADTTNMTLQAVGEGYTSELFNMTKESDRKFTFLAVFDAPGSHTVTVTAYSASGEVTTKEIEIDVV